MRRMPFVIDQIDRLSDDVKQFDLIPAEPNRRAWPHPPGSHVVVETPCGANCYSITSDGTRPSRYQISVRRVGDRGGSAWLHESAEVGTKLQISSPVSAFAPVTSARHHLLIAAGIGVTPILSHARAAHRWGRSFAVIYGHTRDRAPHRTELAVLAGSRFAEAIGRTELAAMLSDALGCQPVGTHAYACGPTAMLDLFLSLAARSGWPEERLHVEHFTAPEPGPGTPFTVVVPDRDLRVEVPSGTTALHAMDVAGVHVPRLCERGVCGQCRLAVTGGIPEHRDLILTKAARAANDCFYPCVSRAQTQELEVSFP
jgi:dimethylamine monooxygenase subunit B